VRLEESKMPELLRAFLTPKTTPQPHNARQTPSSTGAADCALMSPVAAASLDEN